jgi:hypothetical protein
MSVEQSLLRQGLDSSSLLSPCSWVAQDLLRTWGRLFCTDALSTDGFSQLEQGTTISGASRSTETVHHHGCMRKVRQNRNSTS